MALGTSTPTTDDVTALLDEPRFELMPFDSFGEQMGYLPDGAAIAITTSPTLGLEATIDWTEDAAAAGYEIIPHVAARYVRDREHLDEVAVRLQEAGVTDLFVPGGDREEPVGEFESAYELLAELVALGVAGDAHVLELVAEVLEGGEEFVEVGITGYPEGHEFLSESTLAEAMERKAPHATYIVTQLCYDPTAVVEWLETIRGRGVE
jgi:methylenetetrahydrofolate reductase (NADPH)